MLDSFNGLLTRSVRIIASMYTTKPGIPQSSKDVLGGISSQCAYAHTELHAGGS
jgi:hypothetical protein